VFIVSKVELYLVALAIFFSKKKKKKEKKKEPRAWVF
jgi:hypothetical protein